MKSPIALLTALIEDLKVQSCHQQGLDRDIHTITARVEHEGDSFLSVTLATLDQSLLEGLERGVFACPRAFSKVRGGHIPKLFSGKIREVFDAKTGMLLDKEHICTGCISDLHQVFSMFKKLRMSPTNWGKLVEQAQAKYARIEEQIPERRVIRDSYDRKMHFFDTVCSTVVHDLELFETMDYGKHGPGAVREKLSPNEKWRYLCSSMLVDELPIQLTMEEYFNPTLLKGIDIAYAKSSQSEVIAVPKNSTSVRLITIEPLLKQYMQGGINLHLRKKMKKSFFFSQCTQLTNQARNQRWALSSSQTRKSSTIDLSSASDYLDKELVWRTFASAPRLLEALERSRTPYAQFGKNAKYLHEKYAGMGNATTFPVQSIVFAVIAACAILDAEQLAPRYGNIDIAALQIAVYGDDLIVPTEHYWTVVEWLHDFGLTVNEQKSFSYGYFRESCGCDAYAGVDITPIYARIHPSKLPEPTEVATLVSLSNQLWSKAYYRSAKYVEDLVKSFGISLNLVDRHSCSIGWWTRQNARTIERWNETLQRFEYRGTVVRPVKRDDPLDDYPALLKFFHMESREEISHDHLQRSDARYLTRLRKSWCPS